MKLPWIWILLVASVGFNVFFYVGYLNAKRTALELQSFHGRAELFAKPLQLDPHQRQVFEKMLTDAARKRAQVREARLPQVKTFLNELAKPQPDQKVLLDYADQDAMRDYRRTTVLLMRDFMAVLKPQQKQKFIAEILKKAESNG